MSSEMQWFIDRLDERPGVHKITVGPSPDAPGFRKDPNWIPNDVLTSKLPGEWRFVAVEGLPDVFESAPSQEASFIRLTHFKEFTLSTSLLAS